MAIFVLLLSLGRNLAMWGGDRVAHRFIALFASQMQKTGLRPYHVCADSQEEMKRWMNALSLASIKYTKVRSFYQFLIILAAFAF